MTSSKNQSQTNEAKIGLLEPSEALSHLKVESIQDSMEKGETYEQIRYGFTLGAIGLLTPPNMICEILEELPQIYLLPNTAAWFEGLINLRGNLVPVFDIGRLLEVKGHAANDANKSKKNMLVIGSGEKAVAFIIDGLPQPVTAEREETDLPPIAEYSKSFVIKAYSFQERIWVDLDLETYLMSLHSRLAAA